MSVRYERGAELSSKATDGFNDSKLTTLRATLCREKVFF